MLLLYFSPQHPVAKKGSAKRAMDKQMPSRIALGLVVADALAMDGHLHRRSALISSEHLEPRAAQMPPPGLNFTTAVLRSVADATSASINVTALSLSEPDCTADKAGVITSGLSGYVPSQEWEVRKRCIGSDGTGMYIRSAVAFV